MAGEETSSLEVVLCTIVHRNPNIQDCDFFNLQLFLELIFHLKVFNFNLNAGRVIILAGSEIVSAYLPFSFLLNGKYV